MDSEGNSWLRRTSFSHTVCHRLDSSRLPSIPLSSRIDHHLRSKSSSPTSNSSKLASISLPVEREEVTRNEKPTQRSSSFPSTSSNYQSHFGRSKTAKMSGAHSPASSFRPEQDLNTSTMRLGSRLTFGPSVKIQLDSDYKKSGHFTDRSGHSSKSKPRSVSPLPTTILSDSFKEARAESKRFLTPPRQGSDKRDIGRILSRDVHERDASSSPLSLQTSPHKHFFGMRGSDKVRGRKETPWLKYFDHGGGRVAAVDVAEEWMVDLSQLYLGFRFACGAHSRLYHGIYKDEPVAVKIIRLPDDDDDGVMAARLEKQFSREANFLSHLHHRNVIKLVAACRNPPVFCIITEYLPGGSLRLFLHKLEHESLPLQKLISIALDIAHGMEYIHLQGVIHRDLKPENIIFDQDFCVKIADFGIACEEAYSDALADDPGTYRWMAPEMIKHKHYGKKVDVYSFGLVLWEMLTGRIPYEDMTPVQAAFAVVYKNLRPAIPADCPAALRALIEQCWASNPEKRPEFWQIVKVLKHFESVLAQGGTLDMAQNLTSHDHTNRLLHWIQKLKPHPHANRKDSHANREVFLAPKLL
ncbi:Serine/threonine-protein kinase HT1 [Apostasia shenzhenica]|uniref:Serine/threonine-protein kinase HT1 n=1 Tax=Apostasia shenzhenica TaxID=1088818 RepID=A0A2I0A812_9ASPA|nr:Serine/threonine-protein kinase HT1 [Apostasia shenzhenica]